MPPSTLKTVISLPLWFVGSCKASTLTGEGRADSLEVKVTPDQS
jgi:hypothetical protein